jgi:hypothetical protein
MRTATVLLSCPLYMCCHFDSCPVSDVLLILFSRILQSVCTSVWILAASVRNQFANYSDAFRTTSVPWCNLVIYTKENSIWSRRTLQNTKEEGFSCMDNTEDKLWHSIFERNKDLQQRWTIKQCNVLHWIYTTKTVISTHKQTTIRRNERPKTEKDANMTLWQTLPGLAPANRRENAVNRVTSFRLDNSQIHPRHDLSRSACNDVHFTTTKYATQK